MSKGTQEHLPARLWWVLAGLTLVWGFNWTAMKVAITDIAPFTFRTLCLGLGSGVLFAFLRASGQPLAIPRDQWGRLALIAFFNITCWNMLVVFGLATLPSGRAAILAYTMPAWSIPLSVLLLGERLTVRKLLGLALGMAGMVLLLWDEFQRIQGAPCIARPWRRILLGDRHHPAEEIPGAGAARRVHRLAHAAGRRADLHRRAAIGGLHPARGRQP